MEGWRGETEGWLICGEGLELRGFWMLGLMRWGSVVRWIVVRRAPWKQAFFLRRGDVDALVILAQFGRLQVPFLAEVSE